MHLAANLGSVGTLAGLSRTAIHVELMGAQRQIPGIPESLIRYLAGIENVEDILEGLEQALAAL